MKKLSKILSVSLSVVLTMVFVHLGTPVSNAATSYTEGYYTYTVTNGEATITDVDTSISGEITIPSTLGGYPVTSIGALAFFNCSSITSATISDSVTAIGGRAFAIVIIWQPLNIMEPKIIGTRLISAAVFLAR